MRRRIVVGLVMTLPLAIAGDAAAKEPVKAKVCGASDCVEVKDRSLLLVMNEGGPSGPPPRSGAPWYRATVAIAADGHRERFELAVVPSGGYIRSRPDGAFVWMRMPERGQTAWQRVTRGLEPRPAADLRGLETPAPGTAAAARVDEVVVVEPPTDPASSAYSDSPAWPWIVTAAAGLGLLGIVVAGLRRRRAGARATRAASRARRAEAS
jgi:MYXO-CTERM domain-containing protein